MIEEIDIDMELDQQANTKELEEYLEKESKQLEIQEVNMRSEGEVEIEEASRRGAIKTQDRNERETQRSNIQATRRVHNPNTKKLIASKATYNRSVLTSE